MILKFLALLFAAISAFCAPAYATCTGSGNCLLFDNGTVSPLYSKWPSVADFGAVCDGTTDDKTAVNAALAAYPAVYISPGKTCYVSEGAVSIPGKLVGDGVLKDSSGYLRAPRHSLISSNLNPSWPDTNTDSVLTAFNGNYSGSQWAAEHIITGANTLGTPTTGYHWTPWAAASFLYLYGGSGWNNSLSDQTGRTMTEGHMVHVDNYGQGDVIAFACQGLVASSLPGATTFWSEPAVGCWVGDLSAASAGAYLNPYEMHLQDLGNDVSAVGIETLFNRTNNTGALQVGWAGEIFQSVGTKAIDVGWELQGPALTGMDLTRVTWGTSAAALATLANSKIYLNSTASATFVGNTPGTEYIYYSSTNSCISMVAGNRANLCFDTNGHVRALGSAPSVGTCGTSPSVSGTDTAGIITTGSTATISCVLTFNVSYVNPPICVVSPLGVANSGLYATTLAATLTLTYTSATSVKFAYHCYANAG